jgi:sugar phosphate isomerase/epimerase
MLSFSTCWSSHRHTEGEPLVREILEMGFDTIEISHGLKVSLLPGILKCIDAGLVKVSGVHNFCPSPVELMIDAPDAYEFTSHRPHNRERALALTLKTIEFGAKVKAKYVVLHMGSTPMKPLMKELQDMAEEGQLHSREFVKKKLAMIKERERLGPFYCERSKEALKVIIDHAEKHDVPVAIESRSHYEQVPTEREMVEFMKEFHGPFVGYWHDFGHVQLKHNLGLLDHEEWLGRMEPYLIGCHLHDVVWPRKDHRVPFQGSVDYASLLPMVNPAKPIVWELSLSRRKQHVLEGLAKWREKFPQWS